MSEEAEVQTEDIQASEEIDSVSSDEEKQAAAEMGWADKPDFRGDPEKWRPAKEFLERGKNILPILKERNEKLVKDMAELKTTMAEFQQFYSKSEQRQYAKSLKELKSKQKQAVEEGDSEAFTEIDKEIEALNKDVQDTKAQPTNPAYEKWVSENEWYLNDPELHAYADSVAEFLRRTKPHLVNSPAVFDEVKKLTKSQFPDKFENPARKSPSTVEGGTKVKGGKPKRSFDTLPADAKEQCKKFERTIPGFKREDYVKDFDWDGYEKAR